MGAAERTAQEKRMQLLRDAAAGSKLMDRFGRAILQGGTYTFDPRYPILIQVTKITPIIDLRAEPGMHKIELFATIELIAKDRVPIEELLLVSIPTVDAPPVEPTPPAARPDADDAAPGGGIILTDGPQPTGQSQEQTTHDDAPALPEIPDPPPAVDAGLPVDGPGPDAPPPPPRPGE